MTHTPGYEPNANPRAESAVNVIKTRARVMLQSLGPEGRSLWPCAVQHACWASRQGAKRRTALVPAFGDTVTSKIKNTPSDGFAPRGRDAQVLGCVDNVTSGVLVGNYDGYDWDLEVVSSYVLHGTVEVDLTQNEEECEAGASSHDAVEAAGGVKDHETEGSKAKKFQQQPKAKATARAKSRAGPRAREQSRDRKADADESAATPRKGKGEGSGRKTCTLFSTGTG